MKKFIVLLGLFLLGNNSFAFDVVYPKKNDVIINAKSTFLFYSGVQKSQITLFVTHKQKPERCKNLLQVYRSKMMVNSIIPGKKNQPGRSRIWAVTSTLSISAKAV